jgi:hypothetical protein
VWRLLFSGGCMCGTHAVLAVDGAVNLNVAKLVIRSLYYRDLGNAGLSAILVPQFGVLTKLQYL